MSAPQHTMTDTNGNLWTIPAGAIRAVGRFNPDGPTGYRAAVDAPIRATRAEAMEDVMAALGLRRVPAELQARIEAAL